MGLWQGTHCGESLTALRGVFKVRARFQARHRVARGPLGHRVVLAFHAGPHYRALFRPQARRETAMAKGEKTHDRSAADRDLGRDAEGEDAGLKARLDKLSEALDKRQIPSEPSDDSAESTRQSLGAANLGFRALVEFVTAVVVAPIIGWQIDAWLKTQPVFLIIFLILGMVAGLANVYRIGVGPAGPTRGSK
jgi:ATP synthase protein I